MSNNPLIEADRLARTFGSRCAVADVSFKIGAGEIVGLLGANGAGKSTTLKMLTGFLRPSSGSARIAGHEVTLEPLAARAAFGYLPERGPLYEEMTVREVLEFAARVRRQPMGAAAQALAACELQPVQSQMIETLSKGFRQRVGLAQAILHDPPALLLDEPLDGLDPNQKDAMRRLLGRMAPGKAILFSTHILEDVEALCTRVIVIVGGRVAADETPAAMQCRHPAHGTFAVKFPVEVLPSECCARAQALGRLEGVMEASAIEGGVRVRAHPGAEAEGDVLAHAVTHGWKIARVERPVLRLEDVFRQLTRSKSAGPEAEGRK